MSLELDQIYWAEKSLSPSAGWKRRADDESLRMVAPLSVGGASVEGLIFGMRAHLLMPDRALSAQIEYHPPGGGRQGGPICRIEWRPIRPHNNKGVGPEKWRFRTLNGSHHHPFDLNWAHSETGVRRGRLPIAVPIEDDPSTYRQALAFFGKEFRIKGVESLPVPPWERRLL